MDHLNFNNDKRGIEKALRSVEEALSEATRVLELVKHHVPHVDIEGERHLEEAARYFDMYHHIGGLWDEFVDARNALQTIIGEELADREDNFDEDEDPEEDKED